MFIRYWKDCSIRIGKEFITYSKNIPGVFEKNSPYIKNILYSVLENMFVVQLENVCHALKVHHQIFNKWRFN